MIIQEEPNSPAVLLILDEVAVSKGAVMLVEVSYYDLDNDMETFPSAENSRKMWSKLKEGRPSCNFCSCLTYLTMAHIWQDMMD